ncbi:unnamed protein product [Adineta ricciae]|uniref:Inosine/uridine-preferring nucleoside hydrolase domain-containing protein n=1 Tax=Adineta ricciae TaxID=249248 RepID=A0A815DEL8_ADIRI|nr:unnamed protein product [Adineta ricciae]CAF1491372.1 unnamed protein product [Adineta ricciae]
METSNRNTIRETRIEHDFDNLNNPLPPMQQGHTELPVRSRSFDVEDRQPSKGNNRGFCTKQCLIGLAIGLTIGVILVIVIAVPVGVVLASKATGTQSSTMTNSTSQSTSRVKQVQNCISQDITRQPVLIDTDTDIDDLWAILYLLNVPTVDILAITTSGDGYSTPFYSTSNILSLLGLVNCTDGVGVATGASLSLSPTGWIIASSILKGIDSFLTSPTCLNQSTNIFLQPSPFDAVELIISTLKYSQRSVDILCLGPMTNIAEAISRDRSIVSKIGTLYLSGGQFKSIADYPSLVPNPSLGVYPYSYKTSGSSSNVFLDVLAVQRVDDSGIKNLVAMPSSVQKQLTANLTQLNNKIQALNLQLSSFTYGLISSLAKCTNQTEGDIFWWDNSAAQLMVQMQNNVTNGFCTNLQKVQSLYVLSADGNQLYGQGLSGFDQLRPNTQGLTNYTICTRTNSDLFLTEFLTTIASNRLDSCAKTYQNRFDIKLQACLNTYGYE